LEHGADDYMAKPFNLEVLILRIRGMLKIKAWYQNVRKINPLYKLGNNAIYFEKLICVREDKIITLLELLENVRHINPEIEILTVDNFIIRLRKNLEDDPSNPAHIKSERSTGYIFSHQVFYNLLENSIG